ncbi:MAG: DeoR/GlpR family DNA-binding transcription regulator [Geothermobacteraceae bacterium]
MNGTERRRDMLKRLQEQGSLGLSELAEIYGVSKMTIHRDLALLEERGQVRRIHGGAVPVRPAVVARSEEVGRPRGECLICYRPATQHLLYRITLRNGEQREACCPHCGMAAHLNLGDQVAMAQAADYLSGQLHSAQRSFYLLGSSAAPCCRPSILAFADEESARRFQTGFGGTLGRLEDAIAYLEKESRLNPGGTDCPTCWAIAGRSAGPSQ